MDAVLEEAINVTLHRRRLYQFHDQRQLEKSIVLLDFMLEMYQVSLCLTTVFL